MLTPFSHQANLYRRPEQDSILASEYEQLVGYNLEKTRRDIWLGNFSLNAIRAVMIHKLRYGESFINVSSNTDLNYLSDFSHDDVDETLLISESFNSALQMRRAVKRYIGRMGLCVDFPEFFADRPLFHWGISKKAHRPFIQPNFKIYKGRLVSPGYALPVYSADTHECLGLTSYTEHSSGNFSVVIGPNGLPSALVERN